METTKITTLEQFAELINESREWRADFYSIIESNGWEDLTGDYYNICRSNNRTLYIGEDGRCVIADNK